MILAIQCESVSVIISVPVMVQVPVFLRVPVPVHLLGSVSVPVIAPETVSGLLMLCVSAHELAMVCGCVHVIPSPAEIASARVSLMVSVPLTVPVRV